MNKVLRIIRSRFFISGLVIFLQFIQLMIVFILLTKYSIIISILGYVFYIGVFIYIINKYENPEFKLPWIIIIMLFFVVGAFAFIILSGSKENDKLGKIFKENRKKMKPYLEKKDLEELKNKNLNAYLQANYINKATGLPVYKNTKVSYYEIGSDFHKALLYELKKAQCFIFMEYFIIEDGLMWNSIYEILKDKCDKGVKIYVIYDDFGCMTTLHEKYYEKLNNEGINCLPANKFKPILSKIHNNRDHRKITVIDGKVGFTGGINLADEYINEKEKFGHWKDTAVKLEGEAVKNLTALFLETWNTQSDDLLDAEEFMDIKYDKLNKDGWCAPYGDGPLEFYQDNIGKNVYLNMINSAKKYIYITTPYLICDYEILNALCLCAKKGIDVRIITPHIPDKKTIFLMTQSNYQVLIENGVKIYEYIPGFIHAKNFICDDKYAICGTINLDYRSLVHHFECGVWMYNIACIKEMKIDFINTLNNSLNITLEKSKLKGWKKLTAEIMKVFSPLL